MKFPQIIEKYILLLLLSHLGYGQSYFNQGETKSQFYSAEIPFEFINQKIILPVKIDDKIYRFMLDTGAPNYISQKIYHELKPEIIDEILITDANNFEKKEKLALIKKLEIGGILFENSVAFINQDDENIFLKCWGIDGNIGSDLLRNSIIRLNLEDKIITLANHSEQLCYAGASPTKILFFDNQSSPFIWVNLMEKGPKQQDFVMIDTGMHGLYDMSLHSFKRLKDKVEINLLNTSTGASVIGFSGKSLKSIQHRLQIPLMKVGHFNLKNTITVTTPSEFSRMGAELLNNGIMTIDYVNENFYFQPHVPSKDFNKGLLDFSRTLRNNESIVGFVWDESLKDKLQYGDKVIEIDGHDLSQLSLCEVLMTNFFPEGLEPFDMKFQSSNGVPFSIKIKKSKPHKTK